MWQVGGTAGEDDAGSSRAATVTSSTEGGATSVTTCIVGKPPQAARQRKGHMRGHLQVRKLGLLTTTRLRRGPDIS
jgi:uncharacterized protein YndB with AHSA1/START domain